MSNNKFNAFGFSLFIIPIDNSFIVAKAAKEFVCSSSSSADTSSDSLETHINASKRSIDQSFSSKNEQKKQIVFTSMLNKGWEQRITLIKEQGTGLCL